MLKSTTFRSVSYGPCSRTGVTCVASDFETSYSLTSKLQSKLIILQ